MYQNIVNDNRIYTVIPTISGTSYTAGDSLGGLITIDSETTPRGGASYLEALTLIDLASNNTCIDCIIFCENPSNSTITDNSAFTIADADMSKIIGTYTFTEGGWIAFADNSVNHNNSFSIPLRPTSIDPVFSRTIYAALIERGTPTRTNGDIIITFQVAWLGA